VNGRDAVRWPVSERPEAKAVDGALGQAVAAVVERMNLPAHWPSEAKARGALSGAFKKSIQLLSFFNGRAGAEGSRFSFAGGCPPKFLVCRQPFRRRPCFEATAASARSYEGWVFPLFFFPPPLSVLFSFMVALGCRVQRHRVASAEAEGRSGGGGRRREGRAVCKPVAGTTNRKRRSEVHRVPHFGVLSGGRECGRRNARDAALWSPARQFWACVAGTGLRRLAEYRSRKPER